VNGAVTSATNKLTARVSGGLPAGRLHGCRRGLIGKLRGAAGAIVIATRATATGPAIASLVKAAGTTAIAALVIAAGTATMAATPAHAQNNAAKNHAPTHAPDHAANHAYNCPSSPLVMTEVAEGIFVRHGKYDLMRAANHGGIANIGFIIGKSAVAVIDSGGSLCDGQRLARAIEKRTSLPIRFVINTHVHPDHIFGNAAFADKAATFVGHRNLPRAMAQRGAHYLQANLALMGKSALRGIKIIPPTLLVKDRLTLQLGARELELTAWPAAHTDQDLTIYDRKTATLFTGDLVFSRHIPVVDGSLIGWLQVIQRLRTSKARRIVPGHGPVSMTLADGLAPEQRYLTRLARDIRAAIKNGETMSTAVGKAAMSEKHKWKLFGDFNARNATAAFAELEWE